MDAQAQSRLGEPVLPPFQQIDAVMGIGMVKGRRPRGQGTVRQRCSMRWAPPQIRRIFQFFFVVWFTPPCVDFRKRGEKARNAVETA